MGNIETREVATRGVLWENVFFQNFAKFTGKHLSQSSFFNKVAVRMPATSLKRCCGTGVFL